MNRQRHWLFKSDPEVFSWEDLKNSPDRTTYWDGVRNFQARNMLRDEIQKGDLVLFYHSQTKPPAVMGTARVVRSGYPDHTAQDPESGHFDPEASPDNPRWYMVDIRLEEEFKRPVPLPELRRTPGLENMELLRKGSRLSVQPVSPEEFEIIQELGTTS
ncbi:MAG: EVE domain-containing protein [Thermodesulfobacteriota bacterium]